MPKFNSRATLRSLRRRKTKLIHWAIVRTVDAICPHCAQPHRYDLSKHQFLAADP